MSIVIDDQRRPIIVVTFDGAATDAEFDDYLRDMKARVLDRREKTVTILDARRSTGTTAAQRRKQAEWLRENDAALRSYSLGTAFVITSPIVRGVLTAILWMQPMPAPHSIVATLTEAEAWAQGLAKAAIRKS